MEKIIKIIICSILTSFFFFPFEFTVLPGLNTKMAMAGASIAIICIRSIKMDANIKSWFLILCIYASLISLSSLFSVFYNNTPDYTYVTYFVSMLVWLGGAYTLTTVIRLLHGHCSIPIAANYLIGVCAFHCILALAINRNPAIDQFCNSICYGLEGTKDFADGRLYSIGCAFDVAGMRFAAVLITLGIILSREIGSFEANKYSIIFKSVCFVIIAIIGSMIARTTSVGIIIALLILLFNAFSPNSEDWKQKKGIWIWLLCLISLSSIFVVFFYNSDARFKEDFEFAFEGFFSLIQTGKWQVHSNDVLLTMYVFPDNLKTWLIGDGYFINTLADPNYIGIDYGAYYKSTDVGYLRFIFYSGLIGLFFVIAYIMKATDLCIKCHKNYTWLFVLLCVLQLIVWGKVASDIFLIYAIFLVCDSDDKNEDPKHVLEQ